MVFGGRIRKKKFWRSKGDIRRLKSVTEDGQTLLV